MDGVLFDDWWLTTEATRAGWQRQSRRFVYLAFFVAVFFVAAFFVVVFFVAVFFVAAFFVAFGCAAFGFASTRTLCGSCFICGGEP